MNVTETRTSPGWFLAALAAAVVLSLGASVAMKTGLTYPCPFKFLFQIPCPTCGATRAFAALASFDVMDSLRFNPFVLLGSIITAIGFAMRGKIPALGRFALPVFLTGFAVNWLYLILFLPR